MVKTGKVRPAGKITPTRLSGRVGGMTKRAKTPPFGARDEAHFLIKTRKFSVIALPADIKGALYKIKKKIYSIKSPAERLFYIKKILSTKLGKVLRKNLEGLLENLDELPAIGKKIIPGRLEDTLGETEETKAAENISAPAPAPRWIPQAGQQDYSKPAELEGQLIPGQSIERLLPAATRKEMFAQQATYAAHESTGSRLQSTLAHYVAREGITPGQPFELHPAERQLLLQRVSEYLGGTYAEYKIEQTLNEFERAGLPKIGEKPENKYKTRIRDDSI
ncbi:MAG: hypothetical protein HYT16_02680 [DPANN group archaeon]|nr:hypothetical protein [DPANN group archaeon]